MKHRVWSILVTAAAGLLLSGCGANVWEQTFVRSSWAEPVERGAIAPESVVVREAPWPRIEAALAEYSAEVAGADVHPNDWPRERQRAAQERFLRAMQFGAASRGLEILGHSTFSSTDSISPGDGSLAGFAAELGADYAVWSRRYEGRTDEVIREPMTTYTDETIRYRDRHGKRRTESVTSSSTTYVPLVVEADEWAWIAFYVRKRR